MEKHLYLFILFFYISGGKMHVKLGEFCYFVFTGLRSSGVYISQGFTSFICTFFDYNAMTEISTKIRI